MKKHFYFKKKFLLFLLSFFVIALANAQNVDFAISKDSTELGSAVVFKNTSTGFDSTVYYVWTFYDAKEVSTHPMAFMDYVDTTYSPVDSIILIYNNSKTFFVKLSVYSISNIFVNKVTKCHVVVPLSQQCSNTQVGLCDVLCNGGFEHIHIGTGVPDDWGLIWHSECWHAPYISFIGNQSTPDLFHVDATCPPGNVWVGAPGNFAGIQTPYNNGKAYAGITCYQENWQDYREYIQTNFISPLIPGLKYKVGMQISLAEHSAYYIQNKIGMYFASNTVYQNAVSGQALSNGHPGCGNEFMEGTYSGELIPQVFASNITNTDWMTISGIIDGNGQSSLIIGNFANDDNSEPIEFAPSNVMGLGNYKQAYYYIDSIFIEPIYSGVNQTYYACYDNSNVPLVLNSSVNSDPIITEWVWSDNSSVTHTTNVLNVTQNSTIYCTATYYRDGSYCDIIDTFNIEVVQSPKATVNSPVIDCYGNADLCVTSLLPNSYSYLWSTGATSMCINVAPVGTTTYYVSVYNEMHCEPPLVLEATVYVPPAPPAPELEYFVNNTCNTTTSTFPYSIKNPPLTSGYVWTITPTNAGYFNNNPNLTTATGSSVTITWNYANVPITPNHATINVEVTAENKCETSTTFNFFRCCNGPWVEDPPVDLIILNNATASANLHYASYSDEDILINGNFFIDADRDFLGTRFFMGPEAAIIVDPQIKLSILDATQPQQPSILSAGCQFMWKGIYIDDYRSKLMLNNSTLDDAYAGIDAVNNAPLEVRGDVFTDNEIGVKISNYVNPTDGMVQILSNTFTSTAAYVSFLPPLNMPLRKALTGILVEKSNNITIGDENSESNKFIRMYHGIMSRNSCINAFHNEFEELKRTFGGFSPSVREPGGMGIYAMRSVGYIPVGFTGQEIIIGGSTAKANEFTNCDYGVYLSNNLRFTVSTNHFVGNKTGILACETTSPYRPGPRLISYNLIEDVTLCGIDLRLMKKCNVQFNTIQDILLPSSTNPALRRYGISAKACVRTSIYGNTITTNTNETRDTRLEGINTQMGTYDISCNHIVNMGKSLAFYGNNANSTISRNQMTQSPFGIYLSHAYIGQQGGDDRPSDNSWIGSFDYHTYLDINSTTSDIYVRDPLGQWWSDCFYPNGMINTGVSPFSFLETSSLGRACVTAIPYSPVLFRLNNESGDMVCKDEIEYNKFKEQNKWISSYELYNCIYEEEADSLTESMNEFLTTYGEDNKILVRVGELLNDYEFTNAKGILTTLSRNNDWFGYFLDIYKSIADAGQSLNNASDDILLNDKQLGIMRQIAAQCPYEFGKGVYIAREILSTIEPTIYQNYCEEFQEERKLEKPKDKVIESVSVSVYPNPAKDEFVISFSVDISGQSAKVELYNLFGNQVKNILVNENSKIAINTSDLSSGIYFYRVSLDNTIIAKNKIVIIR